LAATRGTVFAVPHILHTFDEANKLVRQHRPDVLLIEPFLENRDAIRWIKDLAMEFPRIRILIVSRQSERTYAKRALCAGASGYWMKNSSVEELMHAIETVLAGEIYASHRGWARHRSNQAALIQKVSNEVEMIKPAPQVVSNNR